MPRLFCFGPGYVATAFADHCLQQGWQVAGSSRDQNAARQLDHGVMDITAFDDAATKLADVTHILVSIPPDANGDIVLRHHLDALKACKNLQWVGYLGTTGVYGNHQGAFVNEESDLKPTSPRAARRVIAEQQWRDSGLPVHIFRLAGIYGPGRNALIQLQQGKARRLHKNGQVFSRIHRDDIVAVLAASTARPNPGSIYNVCDDLAVPSAEVTEYAAQLSGYTMPPLEHVDEAQISDMARSFWVDNKRIDNRRMHEELGVTLQYPDYKTGMNVLWQSGEGQDK